MPTLAKMQKDMTGDLCQSFLSSGHQCIWAEEPSGRIVGPPYRYFLFASPLLASFKFGPSNTAVDCSFTIANDPNCHGGRSVLRTAVLYAPAKRSRRIRITPIIELGVSIWPGGEQAMSSQRGLVLVGYAFRGLVFCVRRQRDGRNSRWERWLWQWFVSAVPSIGLVSGLPLADRVCFLNDGGSVNAIQIPPNAR